MAPLVNEPVVGALNNANNINTFAIVAAGDDAAVVGDGVAAAGQSKSCYFSCCAPGGNACGTAAAKKNAGIPLSKSITAEGIGGSEIDPDLAGSFDLNSAAAAQDDVVVRSGHELAGSDSKIGGLGLKRADEKQRGQQGRGETRKARQGKRQDAARGGYRPPPPLKFEEQAETLFGLGFAAIISQGWIAAWSVSVVRVLMFGIALSGCKHTILMLVGKCCVRAVVNVIPAWPCLQQAIVHDAIALRVEKEST